MNILGLEEATKAPSQTVQDSPSESLTNPGPSSLASFSSYSGPIPPPHYLVQYEKIIPGSAKKIS